MSNYPSGTPDFEDNFNPQEDTNQQDASLHSPFMPPTVLDHTIIHGGADSGNDPETTVMIEVPVDENHCPYCNAEIGLDHHFCWNCGQPVHSSKSKACQFCLTLLVPDATYCYRCGRSAQPVPEIHLRIIESDQLIALPASQEYHTVGRDVPQQNHKVDIDLGPLGQRKVSRSHARFRYFNHSWYLEDLNSKGGTRIFNARLQPNTPVKLESGMVLYFADVKLKIEGFK